MGRGVAHRVGIAGLLVATPLLAGCTLTGSLEVGAEALLVDVVLESRAGNVCAGAPAPLTTEVLGSDGPLTACRIRGSLPNSSEDTIPWLSLLTARSEDRQLLLVPAVLLGTEGNESLTGIDLTVTFPGPVVAADPPSAVTGRTVHITDAAGVRARGITVVAGRGPQSPPEVRAALLGALGGVGTAALAWGWTVRRRAATGPEPASGDDLPSTPPSDADPAAGPPPDEPPEDPSVWSRP